VNEPRVLELLRAHRLLGDVPDEEVAWLASHGELRRHAIGEVIAPALAPVEALFIILSGRVAMYDDSGSARRKLIEWGQGDVTGLLPYSRLQAPPGFHLVEEPADILTIPGRHLEALSRECHAVTTQLVRVMLDRARHFQREDLHHARLASLGRLAAGLAHELDNPASAVVRGAKLLVPLLREADAAARAFGEAGMSTDRLEAIEKLRLDCLATPLQHVRSPLEQAQHEEAVTDWLDGHGVDLENVESLAETPLTLAMLDELAETVEPALLEAVLRWVAAGCAVHGLGAELGDAAVRISDLVKAVKGFTQMDAAATPQAVDVELGLSQTLAVLRAKARAKSVRITITIESGLPPVRAVAGELNQVWANLIENAVDAVEASGSVEVSAHAAGDVVVVRIADDGPGVPTDIQEKIFEPFFTTKPVGEGTGLGLDIVRRIVDRHGGSIELSSRPGHTEFRISVPVHAHDAKVATT
jgi:signal transduction histidine kinase